jgi:hypothetical protein
MKRENNRTMYGISGLICNTQEPVAKRVGVEQQTASNWVQKILKLEKFVEPPESRQHFAKVEKDTEPRTPSHAKHKLCRKGRCSEREMAWRAFCAVSSSEAMSSGPAQAATLNGK